MMDAKTKLFFERLLQLQLRLAGIVEALCQSAPVTGDVRERLIDATLRLEDSIKKTKETISQ
jgi:ATP phosphoribosyltransferase regulatory subunit HisZ